MARRWRGRTFPPGTFTDDWLRRGLRLNYQPWFDIATELSERREWAIQYEEIDGAQYRRGEAAVRNLGADLGSFSWTGLTVVARASLECVNPCREIVLEVNIPDPREGCDVA